jgi:hypothetical protein
MNDEPMVTEREARQRERSAFWLGAGWRIGNPGKNAEDEAKRQFPITKKMPRKLSFAAGTLWVDNAGSLRWDSIGGLTGSTLPAATIADLLANPFEEMAE